MASLKFIAISGTTGVTENCYLYEYGDDMIMVDCGVGFPEPEMYGVDLVIPDFTYVKQNARKLKGIVITHGHEDHLGALPFLFKDLRVPIYASKLVAGFIEDKFVDYKTEKNMTPKIHVFDPQKDTITLGVFKVTPFRVTHSVPDSCGLCIDTPEGKLFHVPDYKFDWTPVEEKPFDIKKAAILASGDVLCVASDCLGANSPGYTESEKEIENRIEAIVAKAKGAVAFTTISSNISRMQQALRVAHRLGRSVVFVGRSIDRKAEIARRLGYLHYPSKLVIPARHAKKMPDNKLMYIVSGSYGQPGSALYRVALGEHKFLEIGSGDTVIFSADPAPPGSKTNVDFLVDRFIQLGVDVHYYDIQEDLHVSGHGSIEDIKMLLSIFRPKYCVPIGGTIRHMKAYADLAQSVGIEKGNVLTLSAGEVVEFRQGQASVREKIPVKSVLVDGLGVGDVGNVVLRDRQTLAKDGIAIAIIQFDMVKQKLNNTPEVLSRGFVYEAREKDLLRRAGEDLKIFIEKRNRIDKVLVKDLSVEFLEKFFYQKTGRRPMVLPLIVEV